MSLEQDVTKIFEKDIFKPASDADIEARKLERGPLWVSLRVVRANNEEEAEAAVIREEFEEDHDLCDKILPISQIQINGKPAEDYNI